MHAALARVEHRPWLVPARRWTWRQSWRDLLFAHWPVPLAVLRPLLPAGLEVQEFGGTSWVGVVPFRMAGVMRRPWPDLPWVSAFPELNVRLYVTRDGKPGVWFLSLDATNPLAVWVARRFFFLPYHRSTMSLAHEQGGIHYHSRRAGAEFAGQYRPTSDVYQAAAGTLEHWLTERYCLYARDSRGTLWRNEVHHLPWPLQSADAVIERNSMLDGHGISLQGRPLLHFARRLDVVVWDGEPLA
jgi:uncharacterized protein